MNQVWYAAAALACPIGMAVMMWMMMRGNHRTDSADQTEVKRLRAEIEELKSEREHGL